MGCWRDEGKPRKLKHLLKVFFLKNNQKKNDINCIFIIFTPSVWSILSVLPYLYFHKKLPNIKKQGSLIYHLTLCILCTLDLMQQVLSSTNRLFCWQFGPRSNLSCFRSNMVCKSQKVYSVLLNSMGFLLPPPKESTKP